MRQAHWAFDECVICGGIDISIHHILPRGQGGDDVWENLAPLCGSGTHGCHGGVEAGLDSASRALGLYVLRERQDTVDYLIARLGSTQAASEFLRQRLRVSS
jgi:HNH endonuclease